MVAAASMSAAANGHTMRFCAEAPAAEARRKPNRKVIVQEMGPDCVKIAGGWVWTLGIADLPGYGPAAWCPDSEVRRHPQRTMSELRNRKDTSNSMMLGPLLNPKFANRPSGDIVRTSGSRH
jgi:hypothetical protein